MYIECNFWYCCNFWNQILKPTGCMLRWLLLMLFSHPLVFADDYKAVPSKNKQRMWWLVQKFQLKCCSLFIIYTISLSVCLNQAGIVWGQVDNRKAGKFLAMEWFGGGGERGRGFVVHSKQSDSNNQSWGLALRSSQS